MSEFCESCHHHMDDHPNNGTGQRPCICGNCANFMKLKLGD